MTTYADPTRCPDCRALLFRAPQTCPNCRLPLTGQTAGDLFRTLEEADRLITVLREARVPVSVGAPPVARTSDSLVEGLAPYPSAAPPAAPQVAPRVRGTSVPQILLTLGALCLLVAAVTFLAVAWAWLGVSGRTLVLLCFTGTAFALTHAFVRRGLRTASEALSVVGLGLLALDVVGARHAGWLGEATDTQLVLLTGAVVAVAAMLLVVTTTERPLIAPALIAPCAALVGGMGAQADTTSPAPMLVTALVLLALARVGTLVPSRPLAWTAAALAVVAWASAVAEGFSWAGPDFTASHLWSDGAIWPLVVAVALAATSGLVSGLSPFTRPGCSVAALLGGYVAVLPALDNAATQAVVALLVVTAVWTAVTALAPISWRTPPAVATVGAAVAPAVAAVYLFGMAVQAVVDVGAPFSQSFDVTIPSSDLEIAPWLLAPAIVVLTAAACAVAGLVEPLPRRTWMAAGIGAVVVGGVATLPLYDVRLALLVGLLVAIGAGALIGAEWLPDRAARSARGAALMVLFVATLSALPNDVMTASVLAVVTTAAGLLMQRADETGDVASGFLPIALAGFVWSALEVAGVPAMDRGIPIMLLVGGLALWRPQAELEWSAALAGSVAAIGSVTAARDVQLALAIHLTVAGAVVTTSALIHPTRRFLAWPGGLLLAAATWVRLAQLGVHAPEAYTLPTALVLTAVGVWRLWQDDRAATLTMLVPGLTLATVPTLLMTVDDPVSLRAVLLGAACLGLVMAGVALRWSAPLCVGSAVGTVLVLRVLAPYAAQVPTWIEIGVSGVLLTIVGVTWESRMRDVHRASAYVGSLR